MFNIRGSEITNLLNKKEIHSFIESDQMNLFTLEQLIDSSGCLLLTWQQVKQIREKKKKRHIPNWFTKIEKKVLKNSSSREI